MVCTSAGDDPKDTNHTPLRTMAFTFSFSPKSFSSLTIEKDEYQKQHTAQNTNQSSETDYKSNSKRRPHIYGDDGTDIIYLDSEENETNSDDSEPSNTTTTEEEVYIQGSRGTDQIEFDDPEENETNSDDSEPSNTTTTEEEVDIQGSRGTDQIEFDFDNEGTNQEESDSRDASKETSESGKRDPIITGYSHYEAEKVQYIDFWNYDAVNWYTKEDQLAVEYALQSQLIVADSINI